MAITLVDLDTFEILPSTLRSIRTVNTIIAATATEDEVITSVSATLSGTEPGIVITGGVSSVSIVGTYIDNFSDSFTYVSKGSSDKLESPKTTVGVANVPSNKELYGLVQDSSTSKLKTYTITVTYNGTLAQNFTITHEIMNEFEGIRSFMASYYA